MLFNSDIFLFAFLPIVFTLFWLLRSKSWRYALLTVSSYIFYGYWDWRFCFLLLFSSLFSFTIALGINRSQSRAYRRALLVLSIGTDLAILGFFKYYNFFAGTAHGLFPGLNPPILNVVLPIGISFYTFHTISYVVDVASGRVRPTRNVLEYLTYVSLFSQLVAGPIVRFRQIEQDLDTIDQQPRVDELARGVGFFVVGLIKKVVIADQFAALVDPLLANHTGMSISGAWMAALGYTFQIYFDFSGYSDMAVGLGSLFGLHIPQNFNAPYRALGPGDFWRRWHMSLSSWLRDYLYIPLGGNRHGTARTYFNLMITMLLGGLWHGANWTFVIWGAYQGLLLCLDRVFHPWLSRLPTLVYRWGTFLLVVIGWVFFRSPSLSFALDWLGRMVNLSARAGDGSVRLAAFSALAFVAVNVLPETWDIHFSPRRRWAVAYAGAFGLAYLFLNTAPTVFLYYQF